MIISIIQGKFSIIYVILANNFPANVVGFSGQRHENGKLLISRKESIQKGGRKVKTLFAIGKLRKRER